MLFFVTDSSYQTVKRILVKKDSANHVAENYKYHLQAYKFTSSFPPGPKWQEH